MNTADLPEFEDVAEAVRANRPLQPARAYRIQVSVENLDFQPVSVPDPVPLGRQILEAANRHAETGYSLFAVLASGDFEDVRLDETFDLRGRGAEKFIAFLTDRDFKFEVNGRELRWGKPAISGRILHQLAQPSAGEAVFLEVAGGRDKLIEVTALVDLNDPGIERFIVAPKPPVAIEIIVNTRPKLVNDAHVTFEQIVHLAFPGPHAPDVVFSMTYRRAASLPHAGELGALGSVEVKKGTVFNVTRTVQS